MRNRRKARRMRARNRAAEGLVLCAGEGLVDIGTRKVRKDALHPHMGAALPNFQQPLKRILAAHADASHAGIDLQMRARDRLLPLCRALERLEHLPAGDGDGKSPPHSNPRIGGGNAPHCKNRPRNSGRAQRKRLFEDGDSQHIRPRALKPLRNGKKAVAIGIRLDHGHRLCAASDRRAYPPKIPLDRGQRNQKLRRPHSASTSSCERTLTPLSPKSFSARSGSASLRMISA